MSKIKLVLGEVTPQPDNSWMVTKTGRGYTKNTFKGNGQERSLPNTDDDLVLYDKYSDIVGNPMANNHKLGGSLMTAASWRFYENDGSLIPAVDATAATFARPRYSHIAVKEGFDYRCTEGTGALGFALDPKVKALCEIINPNFSGLAWGIMEIDTFGSSYTGTGVTSRYYNQLVHSEYYCQSSMWVYTENTVPGDVRVVACRLNEVSLKAQSYSNYGRRLRHQYIDVPDGKWTFVETQSVAHTGTLRYNNVWMKNDKKAWVAFPYYTNSNLTNDMKTIGKGGW